MSGEPSREHGEAERETTPRSPFGKSGAQFWAQHVPAATNTDANRDRSQKARHDEHGHDGEHTDATIVTPGVTPGVHATPGTGGAGPGAGAAAAPAGPTAADTTAWLAAGATYITG